MYAKKQLHFFNSVTLALHCSCVSSFSFSVGSYFALQWLANFLVAATTLGQNCVQSKTAGAVLFLVNLFASFGLSIIGTNLLCHRYLVEKACVMIKLYGTSTVMSHVPPLESRVFSSVSVFNSFSNCSIDDANDPSVKYLEMLEGSLVWEVRSLFFVAVGAPAYFIYRPVGVAIAGLGVPVVIVMVLLLVCSLFALLS
jgi:hypothetical protein